MKTSFIVGLVSFWAIVAVIMGAGFVSYETQKMNARDAANKEGGADLVGGISEVDQQQPNGLDPLQAATESNGNSNEGTTAGGIRLV